jgi:hypothetical protein
VPRQRAIHADDHSVHPVAEPAPEPMSLANEAFSSAHGSINLKATFQWKEHRPLRSQARRLHPGQAQSSVPAWQRTRVRCWGQVRPREAGR